MKKILFIISILLISLLTIKCSKDDKVIESTEDSFPIDQMKAEILTNIADQIILPQNRQFVDDVLLLKNLINTFTLNPDQNNLLDVQAQWKQTQNQWQLINLYELGPVQRQFLFFKIDTWPSNIPFITDIINGTDSISSIFIEGKGSTVKGLPAIENFIFSLDNGNQAVLDSFNLSNNQLRRKQFLNALAENLYEQGNQIDSIWDKNRGNYYNEFISNTTTGINGSLDSHINRLIELMGFIVITKLEKPLGSSSTRPDLTESLQSQNSINNINQNMLSIDWGFNTNIVNSNQKGIDDLLNQLNAKRDSVLLTTLINYKLDSINLLLNELNSTSIHLAVDNEPQKVTSIIDKLKELQNLFKIEVADALDVTVTFSDNDGD